MAIDRQTLLDIYPQYAWAVNIPEVNAVFEQALANPGQPWAVGRVVAALQETEWWKKTEPSVRTFQERLATDPGAIDESIREREAQVWDKVQKLGLNLGADAVREISRTSIQFNLSEEQITDSLVGRSVQQGYQGARQSLGGVQNSIDLIKTNAAKFFVNVDDTTAYNYAMTVANGEHAVEDYQALFRDQAKARFSYNEQIVKQIDAGFTPDQIFQTQKAKIAQLLEVDQAQVNLMDNKWSQVLDYADPASGQRRTMTEAETAKLVRGTTEWRQTTNAQQAGTALLGNIKEMFEGTR